jgi:hypothetical protein
MTDSEATDPARDSKDHLAREFEGLDESNPAREVDAKLLSVGIQPARRPPHLPADLLNAKPEEMAFFGDWLRRKVEQMLRWLRDLVAEYGDCVDCIRHVTRAADLFGKGQYIAALNECYAAFRCFDHCAK